MVRSVFPASFFTFLVVSSRAVVVKDGALTYSFKREG